MFFQQNVCDKMSAITPQNSCRRPTGLMSSEEARRLAAKKSWGANQVPTLDMKKAEKTWYIYIYIYLYIFCIYSVYIYIHSIICEHGALIESCGVDSVIRRSWSQWSSEKKLRGSFDAAAPVDSPRTRDSSRYSVDLGDFFLGKISMRKMMRNDEKWWDMMRNDTDRIWSRSAESPSSESWQASYAMMPPFERAVKQAEAIQAEARKSQQWHVNNVPWLPSLHNSPYIIIYHQLSSHISILWSLDSIDRYGVDMDSMRFSPKHWRMVAIEMWILTLSSPGRCSPYQKRSRTVPEPRMPRECHRFTQWRRLSFCCSHLRLHEIYDMLIYVTYVTYVNHYHIL